MRQLARAVGVRESALYHHFSSKESILEEVVSEPLESRLKLLAGLDYPKALREGLRSFLGRVAHQAVLGVLDSPRERRIARIKILEAHRLNKAGARRWMEPLLEGIAGLFRELIHRKQVRGLNPSLLAREFVGPLQMLVISSIVLDEPCGPEKLELIDEHLDFFIQAVAPACLEHHGYPPVLAVPPFKRSSRSRGALRERAEIARIRGHMRGRPASCDARQDGSHRSLGTDYPLAAPARLDAGQILRCCVDISMRGSCRSVGVAPIPRRHHLSCQRICRTGHTSELRWRAAQEDPRHLVLM